jgi:transcriptional repressor NrdR
VKDSRRTEESTAIRRRRACEDCGGRFTTFERVQLREIFVVKRSGRREPFDRAKLLHSVAVALRKRPIQPDVIERTVSDLVRKLESLGEQDVPSSAIGELAMDALKVLDPVAYVRFASVYRDFRGAADFQAVLAEIAGRAAAAQETPGSNGESGGRKH